MFILYYNVINKQKKQVLLTLTYSRREVSAYEILSAQRKRFFLALFLTDCKLF